MHTISSPNIRMPICSTRIGMSLFTNRCMIVELLPTSFISRSSWFIQHLCDSSSCSCNQHTKTYDAKAYLLMDDEGSYTAISYVLLYSHTYRLDSDSFARRDPHLIASCNFITVLQCGYRNRRRRRYVFTAAASTLLILILSLHYYLWLGCCANQLQK